MSGKFAVLLFIATFILSSCSFKFYDMLFYDQELHGIQITGQVTEIEIIENRLQASDKDIEIPYFLIFGYDKIIYPALTNSNKQLLERKVRSYFTNTGKSIKVKCYIVNIVISILTHLSF